MTEYYNLYPEDTSEYQNIQLGARSADANFKFEYIPHDNKTFKPYTITMILNNIEFPDNYKNYGRNEFEITRNFYKYDQDGEVILVNKKRIDAINGTGKNEDGPGSRIGMHALEGGPHLVKLEINKVWTDERHSNESDFFTITFGGMSIPNPGIINIDYKEVQVNYSEDDLQWQGPSDIEGLVDLSNRFSPRVRSNGIGIYPVNQYQLADLFADLWSVGFIEGFFHDLLGDPLDGIISLRYYYGVKNLIDTVNRDCYLTIGNVKFNGMVASETPIITKPAQSEFVEIDMGEVRVPEYHGNFLDNAPYTQVEIYIPFYGYYSMNATEVRGNSIKLTYNLNISSGVAVANVYRLNPDGDRYFLITSLDCDLGVDVPINITAMETLTNKVTQRAVEGGKALGSMAMGAVTGPAGAMTGSAMMGASQQSEPVSRKERIGQESQQTAQSSEMVMNGLNNVMEPSSFDATVSSRHGGMSSETGSMSDFRPALFITRPIVKAPANYNQMVGKPDYSTGKVKDYSGYIKVGSITKGDHDISRSVFEEIVKNLRGGVYVD